MPLDAAILQAIRDNVADSVRTTVNGKIDKISAKLDGHIEQHAATNTKLNFLIALLGGTATIIGSGLAFAIFGKLL